MKIVAHAVESLIFNRHFGYHLKVSVERIALILRRGGDADHDKEAMERMLNKHICRLLVLSLVALIASSTARADSVSYGDFFGTNVSFLNVREGSSTDPVPLFGAPMVVNNRLLFNPLTFTSFANDGDADVTSGTLSVVISASQAAFLEVIRIVETGDFTMLGSGTDATSATINGLAVATDLDPGIGDTMTAPLAVTPDAPYHLPTDGDFGEFEAVTEIDLTGLGIRTVILNLNNNLQTTSEEGTSSFIQKKTVEIEVEDIPIPEPTTAMLLAVAAVGIIRRRR